MFAVRDCIAREHNQCGYIVPALAARAGIADRYIDGDDLAMAKGVHRLHTQCTMTRTCLFESGEYLQPPINGGRCALHGVEAIQLHCPVTRGGVMALHTAMCREEFP